MLPGSSRLPAGASALEAPEGRPAFVSVHKRIDHPVPASAVRRWAPDPPVARSGRPECGPTVYLQRTPEMNRVARCTGYAFITPDPAGREVADVKALVRSAIHAAAPDLRFDVVAISPIVADMGLRFASPEDRVAAIARQPFELDGYSVQVVPEGQQRNCYRSRLDYLVHINLHSYPREERAEKDIGFNMASIGHVVEIDPACLTAPDLSPLRLVVRVGHPREIARELRIRYVGFYGSGEACPREVARSIVPIEIVKVWDQSPSNDGNGGSYVSPFKPSPAGAP
nr:uncharacterized protein LOC120969830 [Aegilops tauschii subsp. strangulata]